MRRLQPPTLLQWGCVHRWKTHTSRPGNGSALRVRYLKCLRCGLRVKTEERVTVPWGERDLVALVNTLLPEGTSVCLRDQGIAELPLYQLNTLLASQGYMIQPYKVRDARRFVRCLDRHGRVERFGLFELRRIHQEAPGRANGKRHKGSRYPRAYARGTCSGRSFCFV